MIDFKRLFYYGNVLYKLVFRNFIEKLKLNFDYHNFVDLPIKEVISQIKKELRENNTLVLNAPAGVGKGGVPLTLLDEDWLDGQKIIMLETRRLATRAIASRMSDLLGEKIGQRVGYRIRFDTVVSKDTRIEVVTEGILTRMLQSDNALEGIGLVIFDEFHERSLFADVAMALTRESQQVLRPDLRLLVMSATLDMPGMTSLLNCSSIVSKGRQYPVDIIYTGECDVYAISELTARVVSKAYMEQQGDILVFLP